MWNPDSDDGGRKATKKKRSASDVDVGDVDSGPPPAKRARDGKIRVLSANTCGFDGLKWAAIEKMSDDKEIDLICLQEGPNAGVARQIVDATKWEVMVTSEKPNQGELSLDGYKASVSVSQAKNYLVARRKSTDTVGLAMTEKIFRPTKSGFVCDHLRGNVARPVTTSRGRTQKAVRPRNLDRLGLRPPQQFEVNLPGYQPLGVLNYHAPQGSGSGGEGYSGMDAASGHELMSEYMKDMTEPVNVLVGDQNAHASKLASHYGGHTIVSAGSKDKLSHAVCSSGARAQRIDLKGMGDDFNNKGAPGCSDHSAFAFEVQLPQTK